MRPKGQFFDLKQFREDHNLTQRKIAQDVKLHPSFLSAIEHGRRPAPDQLLDKLCELYKVNNIADYLSDREEKEAASYEDINNSLINSPGGSLIINELGKVFTAEELKKLLLLKDVVKEQIHIASTNACAVDDSSLVLRLIKLLETSEARNNLAINRIKELEAKIEELQSQLQNN